MSAVLAPLTYPDYTFLIGLIESPFNVNNDAALKGYLDAWDGATHPDGQVARAKLDTELTKTLRYLGSSEVLYWARTVAGQEPGAPVDTVVRDVAKRLKVTLPAIGTTRELLEALVTEHATQQFATLTPAEQQLMLIDLGVDREEAQRFLMTSAGVFALPTLIQAFDLIVVQGLIKQVVFGTITRVLGAQLSQRLFTFVAGQFPWWLRWVGPAAWTVSIGWTVFDLQGPAQRKTVPAMLYLGLCSLRERHQPDGGSDSGSAEGA
ncbi:MAG: hypothetical protein AAGI71_15910 [Bacteroidota bacterium]